MRCAWQHALVKARAEEAEAVRILKLAYGRTRIVVDGTGFGGF